MSECYEVMNEKSCLVGTLLERKEHECERIVGNHQGVLVHLLCVYCLLSEANQDGPSCVEVLLRSSVEVVLAESVSYSRCCSSLKEKMMEKRKDVVVRSGKDKNG